ncbi:ephrin-A4 [Erpetoichthys calabaricus]|uniref:Ephrin-A4-like n=1 Tax=Erpetoichthys calabaricus TaxID=27687 RepID=A0A8C4RU82_ERPCA|nr:ephrin-A4 [Erpetoichthys calabaricus]XP_028650690.1 ephrin-A4 [Erpetoichthys calabaricus]
MLWIQCAAVGLYWWLIIILEETVLGNRHTIYWNRTNNRLFKDDYAVQLEINDFLDIYCPHYPSDVPIEDTESFSLFLVKDEEYKGCFKTSGALKRWICNNPHAPYGPVRFSERIQLYTPFTLGMEFIPGQDYYYFSLPSEDSEGLNPCLRLRVTVCCKTTVAQEEVVGDTTTPRSGTLSTLQASSVVPLMFFSSAVFSFPLLLLSPFL